MLTAYLALITGLVTAPTQPTGKPAASRAPARSAAAVPARVQIRKRRLDRWYAGHRLHAVVDYPEVTALADRALQARINRTIQSAYPPPHGLDGWLRWNNEPDDVEPGVTQQLEGEYEITLNRNYLLSMRFYGSDDAVKNGLISGPHPNPLNAAVTLDTRTGRPFKLADLFAGPQWRERLEKLIARYAGLGPRPRKPVPEDPVLIQELKGRNYWCHLTPQSVRFYDLYSAFAGHAVEAEIPLEQLRPLMNPKGPLPSLLGAGTRRAPGRD